MSKRPLVPEAKEGLKKMREEYAHEIGAGFENKNTGPEKLNGFIGGPVGGLMTKKRVCQYFCVNFTKKYFFNK